MISGSRVVQIMKFAGNFQNPILNGHSAFKNGDSIFVLGEQFWSKFKVPSSTFGSEQNFKYKHVILAQLVDTSTLVSFKNHVSTYYSYFS